MLETKTQKVYEFGDFRLVPSEGLLLRDGEQVALTPKAFQILLLLIERRGHLVQKEELLNNVWGDAFVEEQAAAKTVSAVRTALNEDRKNPQFIQTIPKRGYRFVGDVKVIEALGNGLSDTDEIKTRFELLSSTELPSRRRPIMMIGLISVVLVAFTVVFGWGFRGWFQTGRPDTVRSLTVLPFENTSGNPDDQYLVDGVTDSLTTDLSRLSELSFIALPKEIRKSSASLEPKQIGTQIGADAVLIGSVSHFGDQLRITAQLVHSISGKNLWANVYEREARDLQSMQKEVARSVAEEIRTNLSARDLDRLRVSRPVDPEAFKEYSRARYYLNRQNPKDQLTAISSLERAIEIDPTFALAYTDLAQAYTWEHFSFSPEKTAELAEKASVAAAKALELDPNLPEAYLARGRVLWTPGRKFPHARAIKDYRRALELDPKLDEARNQLALVYCHIGALDEALQQAHEGVRINPDNNLLLLRIGQSLNSQGKYKEALPVLREIPEEVHPSMIGHQTAWALFNLGRRDEALEKIENLQKENKDSGGTFAAMRAVIEASQGNNSKAEELIAQAIENGKGYGHFHHTAYTIACAYALMNKIDDAIRYLELAADTGFPCYPAFEIEPSLNNIRQDPRFIDFMSRFKDRWDEIRSDSGL